MKRKDRKSRKSWSEVKMVSLVQLPYSSQGRKAVIQGRTIGIDHPTRGRTEGVGIVKGWEDKGDRGRIADTLT